MQSETLSVQKLFQDRRQYRVPFFQRPYVWNEEDQWERLWSDISEKAEIRAGGDQPSPHFLGAAVLEPQQRRGLLGVEALHIIDGQQRLTTLQYFLSALGIVLRKEKITTLSSLVEGCLWNPNPDTMQQPDVEVFKVWPTFRDRSNYQLALRAASADELRERFPHSFTQSGGLRKIGIDHPPALEAIWYFTEQIEQWAEQEGENRKLARLTSISEAYCGTCNWSRSLWGSKMTPRSFLKRSTGTALSSTQPTSSEISSSCAPTEKERRRPSCSTIFGARLRAISGRNSSGGAAC